jgi:hypothetical protein
MPEFHYYQAAFNAGELSPRLDARTDAKRYKAGLSVLVNGVVRVQGGVERRPGTRFVAESKFSAKRAHLIPFEFSDVQAYALEFGDLYIRFFANGGVLLDTTNFVVNGTFNTDIASWTNSSTGTGSIAWSGAGTKRMDLAGGAAGVGISDQNVTILQAGVKHRVVVSVFGGPVTVSVGSAIGLVDYLAATVLQAGVSQTLTFTPAGTACWLRFSNAANATYEVDDISLTRYAYEVASTYVEADVSSVRWTQSADTLFLVHGSYPPRKLVRAGATSWTISDVVFVDGPYLDANLDTTKTLASSVTAIGAAGTLTAAGHTPFNAGHVGSFWRLKVGAAWGYGVVTGYTSTTVVNWTIKLTIGGVGASSDWAEGAWSTFRGFPRVITLHEDRLWFGANLTKPQTLWATKTSDWVNFTPGANAADPITATISSNKVNVIRWMQPSQVLLVGTLGDEFAVASVGTGTIQPASIQVLRQTSHGGAAFDPVALGSSVIFVQRSGKRLREMAFDINQNTYIASDLALLAEHLFRNDPLVDLAVAREPDQIVWSVRNDGYLLGLTYDKAEDVIGWHRHVTDGAFESICVIPHPNGDRDQLWTIVNRTVGGSTKRYVEVFEDVAGYYELFHADSALQYVGSPVSAVTGMAHLVGETVFITGDGAVHPPQVVDVNGSVALQQAASIVEVGLPYATTVKNMRPDVDTKNGTSQGRKRRWSKIWVRLIDTLGGSINGEDIDYRSSADAMGQAVPLFTGIKSKDAEEGWDSDGYVTLLQEQPLPFEVLAIAGVLSVEETTGNE